LVLAPTRELALQVANSMIEYGKHLHVRVLAVYGGQPYGPQISSLKRGVDVVVGTPGRLNDLLERKVLNLSESKPSCWMKRMKCSTWDSSKKWKKSLRRLQRNGRPPSSAPPCPRGFANWQTASCATLKLSQLKEALSPPSHRTALLSCPRIG
jgi:hypothetical protein